MKICIEQDTDPTSPREWDNIGIMSCLHSKYNLGDKHSFKSEHLDGWDGFRKHLEEEYEAIFILPLYLYDHGSLSISTTEFQDKWDSGPVGFIYTTQEIVNRFDAEGEKIEAYLQSEVEAYNQYLTGDVWIYLIKDDDDEIVDSCGGFFGREDAENEATEALKSMEAIQAKRKRLGRVVIEHDGYVVDLDNDEMVELAKEVLYHDACTAFECDSISKWIKTKEDKTLNESDIPDFLTEQLDEERDGG